MKQFFLLFLIIMIFQACRQAPDDLVIIRVDEIPFDEILDPYGPPKRNRDFTSQQLDVGEVDMEYGLGTHAPSRLNLDLEGKGIRFEAWVGIDSTAWLFRGKDRSRLGNVANYVYDNQVDHYDFAKGSTAIFRVYLDGELHYSSGVMTPADPPKIINIMLTGAEKLTLEVDPTRDGSFADYANWGEARLFLAEPVPDLAFYHYFSRIMVNHSGFLPTASKVCYRQGESSKPFEVVDQETTTVVFEGRFEPVSGDLGDYLAGDFTSLSTPGSYYIRSDTLVSEVFAIKEELYTRNLSKHLEYIQLQRSGHPTLGWAPENHLDDGIRQDNGQYQDVTGGWYDANDLRKPAKGNSLLMYALARVATAEHEGLTDALLLDEIRWGNKFLFAMQEPDGHLLHYIGFTWEGYRENNWTDNIIGTEDDRTIITRPAGVNTHLAFVAAESLIAGKYRETDPDYARECAGSGRKAWEWTLENQEIKNHEDLGLAITAASALYRYYEEDTYRQEAVMFLEELLSRQHQEPGMITGYFFDLDKEGTREGGLVMMGLADFLRHFPDHEKAEDARQAMKAFADEYYRVVARTSAFRIIPWLLSEDSLAGDKKMGPYSYKHFLHVGVNQHLARNGAGLVAAASVLKEPDYAALGQRQLDWIYGANPFNASTVNGIGYNQPDLFKTTAGEFRPHTPELTGGVMTGIGSNHPEGDAIALYPGWWWTTEYWSPTICYTIVLLNELVQYYRNDGN